MILGIRFFRIKGRLFPSPWQKSYALAQGQQAEAMGPARAEQGLEPSPASSYVRLHRFTTMVLREVISPFQTW